MAITKKGIMGPFSGKIGPVVGSTWKDIHYIKSRPQKNGKLKTPTPAQLLNQQKFKFMNDWLEPFYPFFTVGFANLAIGKTELNVAFKINYNEALYSVGDSLSIQYEKVCLSRGNLPGLQLLQTQREVNNRIVLLWDANSQLASYNDQLMLVVYSKALKIADGVIGLAKRSDGKLDFTFNQKLDGQTLEVYLSMVSLNRKKVSDSQYLGRFEP
ncbi:MAG: hypothetical protein EOO96_30200 [Pedobacter sp.]|nr:MAG: hypothetical protein EOO96_30200 [Pedobacter sp.]